MSRYFQLESGARIEANERACLFCEHCTDIWYDWGGVWGITCAAGEGHDIEAATEGKCELFKPETESE